jgi:hypothetical protein
LNLKGLIMFTRQFTRQFTSQFTRQLTRQTGLLVTLFSLLIASSSFAQEPASAQEMKRLQTVLTVINAELKTDLDQILVLQEALKANARGSLKAQGRTPDAISFDEVAAEQRRAIQREQALNARLDAILARSTTHDLKKQSILERLLELGLAQQAPVETAAEAQK